MEMEIEGVGCTSTRGRGQGKRELPHSEDILEPSSPCGSKRRVASEDLPNPIPEPEPEDSDPETDYLFQGPPNPIPKPTPKSIPPIESLYDPTSPNDAVLSYSYVESELVEDYNDYERLVFIDHEYGSEYKKEYHCFNSYECDQAYIEFFWNLVKEAPETIHMRELIHKAVELLETPPFENLDPIFVYISANDAHTLLLRLFSCNKFSENFFKAWKRAFKDREGLLEDLACEVFEMEPRGFSLMFGRTLNQISEIDAETDENVARDAIRSLILKKDAPAAGLCVDLTRKKIALAQKIHLIPCQDAN